MVCVTRSMSRRYIRWTNYIESNEPVYLRGHAVRNYLKVFASVPGDAQGPQWFYPLFERMPPRLGGMKRRTQVLMLCTGQMKCFWYYVHTVAPPRLVGVCDCEGEAECVVCQ